MTEQNHINHSITALNIYNRFYINIRPDKVIFSALELKATPAVTKMIKDLATKLQKENIAVEWLSLPYWVFEPKPL